MDQSFLIKYGEIGLKGKNRHFFEDALLQQMRYKLKGLAGSFHVHKSQGRMYVDCQGDYDYDETLEALQQVFGIVGICPVYKTKDLGFDLLAEDVLTFLHKTYGDNAHTFKVEARRSRKNYPKTSMELNCDLGAAILEAFPQMKVDVHTPNIRVYVEIREEIYIYSQIIPGLGGMPVGSNGSAMLLLSGGIDSPVAGYLIAKRGVQIEATYFHAPPYTSERAKEKVVELARLMSKYTGPIRLRVVNFTNIQLEIYEKCPHEELTIIMRRYMMLIAEHFAKEGNCLGLITGESIGQVASQTLQSLAATDAVCSLPVYRPVIAMDKIEIVEIAQRINTYETSILPYEDCCTIFVAKHPVTKPRLERIIRSEEALAGTITALLEEAIETAEVIQARSDT